MRTKKNKNPDAQGGAEPSDAHNVDPAGSTPAPATISASSDTGGLPSVAAGVESASAQPGEAESTPAKPWHPSQVPDDDPANPRPAFDPERGWQTPAVVEWAKAKANLN